MTMLDDVRAAPPTTRRITARVDDFFHVSERGSTTRREIIAGVSTFLALSYIVVVNPAILGQAGIPHESAFFATALVSGLATICMGVVARLPFAVAPGMEMNALVAVSVIGTLGYSWHQALGMVFWSGIAMLVVSAFRLRQMVIDAIPQAARLALTAAVATFIGLVGLEISGVALTHGGHLSAVGSLTSPAARAMYIGLAVTLVADRVARIKVAAVVAGVAAAALYCWMAGVKSTAPHSGAGATAALGKFDVGIILHPSAWSIIVVLFALDFFGSIAKVVALTAGTPIQRDGRVPGMPQALLTDAGATVVGSGVGSSSFIVYVESAVGIRAGARTGIAAITTGALLLCTLVLGPALTYVPTQAVTGTLVFVAIKMFMTGIPRTTRATTWGIVAATTAVTIVTLAIDKAMTVALVACLIGDAVARRRPHPALIVAAALLCVTTALQYWRLG
jgi:AGZA family xanthine/uracil permease-like MFS transporter